MTTKKRTPKNAEKAGPRVIVEHPEVVCVDPDGLEAKVEVFNRLMTKLVRPRKTRRP